MSCSVVSSPRLTRMADAVCSSGTPMAFKTCDSETLPDEQAEPVLTHTPARSSPITCVWLGTPATEIQIVLGNRATPLP